MVSAEYIEMMARYNRWQNGSLFTAAAGLDDAARRADRGAFFGSIHRTLTHLLWGDSIWMSRFDDGAPPEVPGTESADFVPDWDDLVARRSAMDARIMDWSKGVGDIPQDAVIAWYSGMLDRTIEKPLGLCITHFFNHQTHHRGQVHAMLTAAGAHPDATDLIFMPDTA